jgi:hypothetical protein
VPVASGPRRLLSYCDDGSSLDLLFDELGLGGGVALHGLPTTHTLSETDPLVAHFRRGGSPKRIPEPIRKRSSSTNRPLGGNPDQPVFSKSGRDPCTTLPETTLTKRPVCLSFPRKTTGGKHSTYGRVGICFLCVLIPFSHAGSAFPDASPHHRKCRPSLPTRCRSDSVPARHRQGGAGILDMNHLL